MVTESQEHSEQPQAPRAGCTPDRETWAEIQTAGFAEVKLEHFRAPLWFASPHIAGWASKEAR